MVTLTIEELKAQRRWVLWRRQEVHGKMTKVPFQPGGWMAKANDPKTWRTYAECAAVASQFSGVGVVLGGGIWGCDIDDCVDPSGALTPEADEIVGRLDTYSEYSPSTRGIHILGLGKLPGPGIKRPHPGTKAVEVKADSYFFTYTANRLPEARETLEDRQSEIVALYDRVKTQSSKKVTGLVVSIPASEDERFQKLVAGDMSAYNDDHSAADFALCILLGKKHGCNAFKIDEEFRQSGLYRDKWERDDYRENTITRAILAVAKDTPAIFADPEDEPIEEDTETEFLVESLEGPGNDGWFPKGELSVIGAPSGVGKTSWAMPLLEKIRHGLDVWGHKVSQPRDYRVLLHDRSKKAMRRTARALHMTEEAMKRIIRLSTEQQKREPAEILQAAIEVCPGVEVWFIEGLDLWIPDANKMQVVAPIVDSLQGIATRFNVAVLATVGAPKQKGKDRYFGRDALFGSAALARKVETVVLMSLHDEKDPNSTRVCWILPRAGRAERMFFIWGDGGLVQTTEPEAVPDDNALTRMTAAVRAAFKPDEPIVYRPSLGPERTFYRWKPWAKERRVVVQNKGHIYLAATGVTWVSG